MSTHELSDNASRTQQKTHNPLVRMWREITGHQPAEFRLQAGARAVRPKKDPIQKLSDKAGTLYWKWQELLEKDEDDQEAERQGNKRMGRPPVPLAELRQRAKDAYEKQIEELREAEIADGRDPIPEDEIISKGEKLRVKGPGRPAISEIGRKFRHLRRKLKTYEDALAAIDESENPVYDGMGRPAMSSRERVAYYQREIDDVKRDIERSMSEMPAAERLKIMLDNARIDRRDANMRLKKAEHEKADAATTQALSSLISGFDEEIRALEVQLQEERAISQPAKIGRPAEVVAILPPSGKEYSPGLLSVIAQLESQLIVPKPPAELTPETLSKYKADVALAQEFNATILEQIESLKKPI
ncbi:hypothetical protein ACQCLI_12740 [Pseudomonas nitroreducens]|uniref:hypothetical protein n=1 Tax=Pseudomonas nitroreducens TaxID=46680 RepID=UPI003D040A57